MNALLAPEWCSCFELLPFPTEKDALNSSASVTQKLPFSATRFSAFLESSSITSTSTRFPLGESQKPSHQQNLRRLSG